jgi:hypothetical protein
MYNKKKEVQENWMDRACRMHRERKEIQKICNYQEESHRWEWTDLAQDMDQWRITVNTKMSIQDQ